jgi:Family of unknown function (DUF5681)
MTTIPGSEIRYSALMMSETEGGGVVGYKRPPSDTRFRPGRSGNPAGRPKRRLSFWDALLAELATAMPGKDPEQARSKLQALVKTLVDSAIAGNARAQSLVLGALARLGDPENSETPPLTPDDKEILDAYVGGQLKRRAEDATSSATERHEDRQPDTDDQGSNKGRE